MTPASIFYRGKLLEKISVLLVFYPALVAVNYLMWDIGSPVCMGHCGDFL